MTLPIMSLITIVNAAQCMKHFKNDQSERLNNYHLKWDNIIAFTQVLFEIIIDVFRQNSYTVIFKEEGDDNLNHIEVNIAKKCVVIADPVFINSHRFINTVIFTYIPIKINKVISDESNVNAQFNTYFRDLNSISLRRIVMKMSFEASDVQKMLSYIFGNASNNE